ARQASGGHSGERWGKIRALNVGLLARRSTSMDLSSGSCHACRAVGTALMKFSLGKDFFGRPYDRLSPSSDQSPQWYCESCSMQKNLQRDFRDIRTEYDKLIAGQMSELS